MTEPIKELVGKVAETSTDFEKSNSELKRKYLIRNIYAFNYIVSLISVNLGSFGTGYPFYVLQNNLTGKIPVIQEQIRYNNELIRQAENSKYFTWSCKKCLTQNYDDMPDLKQVCKPCPNMDKELKPRKIINRLPDIDMWMICKDGCIEQAQQELETLMQKYNLNPSDIDPFQTIEDMKEITEEIKKGIMPKKFLPIDAHIIEYSKIKDLIEQVPSILQQSIQNTQIPYLPIHPKSYRKKWQYDDEAYNFIYDFLSAFTEFNFEPLLDKVLKDTRNTVVRNYSSVELYKFLLESTTDSNKRRNKTPELSKIFLDRIKTWKIEKNIDDHEVPEMWER